MFFLVAITTEAGLRRRRCSCEWARVAGTAVARPLSRKTAPRWRESRFDTVWRQLCQEPSGAGSRRACGGAMYSVINAPKQITQGERTLRGFRE